MSRALLIARKPGLLKCRTKGGAAAEEGAVVAGGGEDERSHKLGDERHLQRERLVAHNKRNHLAQVLAILLRHAQQIPNLSN